jgi:hypothetical protein
MLSGIGKLRQMLSVLNFAVKRTLLVLKHYIPPHDYPIRMINCNTVCVRGGILHVVITISGESQPLTNIDRVLVAERGIYISLRRKTNQQRIRTDAIYSGFTAGAGDNDILGTV